jgi:hypothetical protein
MTAPEAPLAAFLEVEASPIALVVAADHEQGLIKILLAAQNRASVALAPEVGLELSRRLVTAAADLFGGRRR